MSQTQQIPQTPQRAEHSAAAPHAGGPLTGYRKVFDAIFAVLAALYVLGVLTQVFFAGLGTFHHSGEAGPGFGPHEVTGNVLSTAGWVLLVVALIAHVSWRTVLCTLVMALLAEVAQHALAAAGWSHQWLGATHALDGMIILLLAVGLAVTSMRRNFAR